MSDNVEQHPQGSTEGFTEPSDDVKRRNRITGFVFMFIIFGMIALAMIVRAYGQ
jgi:hypothetical protein